MSAVAGMMRRWFPFSESLAEQSLRSMATTAYVGGVIATGAALLIQFAPLQYPRPFLALALLAAALILSAFKLRLPLGRGNSTMSMAYAVDFVALVAAGPDLAMVIAAAGVILQCTVRVRRSQPLHRAAFSVSSVVIAVQAAGWAWQTFGGSATSPSIQTLAVPLSAAATTYFAVNTALVAGAIALSSAVSAAKQWYREFFWSAPAYFLSAAVAGMVAMVMAYQQWVLMPLVASPLYLSYRAYQMSVRRLEEERRHAQELTGMIATTQQALARATQSEAALAAEKERLALESSRLNATLRTISDGVVSVDRAGMVLLMNEGAQRLASVSAGAATDGRLCSLLVNVGFEADECLSALDQVLSNGELARLRKDVGGGITLRLVEVTGTPMCDADGAVSGAVFVLRDVSDLARIEHERAKAVRLESLGVLAGGLAHDFNNILMGVVGNLSLAQSMVKADDDAGLNARLTSAAAACARARGVTNQLLTFAKGGAPVKTTTSVRELVTECTRFALSGSPVAPKFDISDHLWEAEVDTVQVGQVVQNLVLNGMQAMPRGGIMEVALQNVELDEASVPPQSSIVPGKYVCLIVRDSGSGIPADVLGRIFDPYFTTKEKGSGLGLAISYSIIRAHNGGITVESEPGVGSRFTVYLPASATRVQLARQVREELPSGFHGRVLIMDDEEMVGEVAQEMLANIGYTATLTASGQEAIHEFQSAEHRGEPYDAVILDLTVPGGMGGGEAVGHIKKIRGDVAALVMSGYADDAVLARYRDYGFDGVLPKPFMIPDLRRVLHEVDVMRTACAEQKEACAFS